MPTNRTIRALGALTLTLTLAFTAAACGDDGNDTNTAAQKISATEHNNADVAFASDMLQHHAQALSMVDLTLDRPLEPDVQQLAEQIRDAQAPEIETFTDWLTDWDQKIPATMRDHVNGGHGDTDAGTSMEGMGSEAMGMPGMMSADDMTALENAPDAEFQTMWLQMMIQHHAGAIDMAKAEQSDGQFKSAIDLADSIITSQTSEIESMKGILGS